MNFFRWAPVAIAATLACTAAPAQTTANGPYYATPSWDQTLPAASRFVVLLNFSYNGVLDRETGLVWWRAPDPTLVDHFTAQINCLSSTLGGRRGWRLPSADELVSLFDPSVQSAPFLPAGHPFLGFPRDWILWTSTPTPVTNVASSNFFATVRSSLYENNLTVFSVGASNADSRGAGVFCVRGGH